MKAGITKDQGWAWMVVAGAFLVNMLVVGVTAKSFGILFGRLKEQLEHSSSATLFIVAISQCLAMVLGPFANMLVMRFTSRWVVFCGGIIIFFGFIFSMFATTIYHLYFTYGVLVGVGSAMAYAPSIVTTTQYFDKRKALANGIAVAGGGIGNFLAPPLMQRLLDCFHLKGSFLILAALMLHICFSGALFRPIEHARLPKKRPPDSITNSQHTLDRPNRLLNPKTNVDTCETLCHVEDNRASLHDLPNPLDDELEAHLEARVVLLETNQESLSKRADVFLDEGYVTSTQESPGVTPTMPIITSNGHAHCINSDPHSQGCCSSCVQCAITTPHGQKRPVFEWHLLQNRVFLIYGFSMFFAFSGYPNVFMIIMPHAKQNNINQNHATFLVSIIGIFDVVGRIGFGWFSDLNLIQKKHGFMITMAVAGIACLLMPIVGDSYIGLCILCAIFGLFAGSFYALLPAILVEGLGEKKLLSAFGLVTLFMGTAFIYATFVVGRLHDLTGEWKMSFYFSGSVMVFGSVIVLLEPLAVRYEKKRRTLLETTFQVNSPEVIEATQTQTTVDNLQETANI